MFYDNAPRIIKETSDGIYTVAIQDEMLLDRQITLIGEIEASSASSAIKQLLHLESEDPMAPITMLVSGPGGSVDSGMAIYDVMQGVSCPVNTVFMGPAASMSAVIFAAGAKRSILPHGRVMIHDPLMTSIGGSATSIKETAENLMNTRQTMAEILAAHTGRTVDEVLEKTSSDTWFDAREAVEFGLADEITKSI